MAESSKIIFHLHHFYHFIFMTPLSHTISISYNSPQLYYSACWVSPEFDQPLKRQTKIAADGILIFYFYLSKKIRLDVSSESSA